LTVVNGAECSVACTSARVVVGFIACCFHCNSVLVRGGALAIAATAFAAPSGLTSAVIAWLAFIVAARLRGRRGARRGRFHRVGLRARLWFARVLFPVLGAVSVLVTIAASVAAFSAATLAAFAFARRRRWWRRRRRFNGNFTGKECHYAGPQARCLDGL